MRPRYAATFALSTLLTLVTCLAFAQAETEHVVYLVNGSVIRGQITRVMPGQSVTLRAPDGNVVVWGMDDIQEVNLEEASRPAAPIAVDPGGIRLSELEARGILESARRSLKGSLRKMNLGRALGWGGVAGCVIGGATFLGAPRSVHGDDGRRANTGLAVAIGGALTMMVASVVKVNAMAELRDLEDTIVAQALGIAKPVKQEKRTRRTRF